MSRDNLLELTKEQHPPSLTDAEISQLRTWNKTARTYEPGWCIHQFFEAAAARKPEAIAVIDQHERISYGELNNRANQLAHHLRSLGVGPEVIVGICLQRSIDLIVGLLAVLKAGGAYLPLDPKYPQERLAFMIKDAAATLVLTQREFLPTFSTSEARVLCLETASELISQNSTENPAAEVLAENLCYVIYTSGSTGRPKGVAIQHASAATLLFWARETFAPEDLARVLATTSICFDLSIFELFVPLSWGGTVILGESVLALGNLLEAEPPTLINTVPSAIVEILRACTLTESVRVINLAGEPLKRSLVDQIYAQLRVPPRVLNLYGPSEDTTYSTFAEIHRDNSQPPIGTPIANTQIHIVDEQLRLLKPGDVGEICIGGDGLARGYLNRPELTAESFIPDPFGPQSGARLYKTGDLGRYLPNGSIEFLGRLDQQVKLSGYRIELGEIEAAMETHRQVNQSIVTAYDYGPDDRRLVAYFVGDPVCSPDVEELRNHLKEKLPEFMVPATFVPLKEFPLTPNKKVDRRALPAPDATRPLKASVVPGTTQIEQKLTNIWAEVLKLDQVGIRDDFFVLGGNSLLAIQAVARVRRDFAMEIPLRRLFEHPTIEAFSRVLETEVTPAEPPPLPLAFSRRDDAPLSFAQQRMWILQNMEPESGTYNIPLVLHLRGELNEKVLEQSLKEITRRHQVLRASFPAVDGQPSQRFADSWSEELRALALDDLHGDELDRKLRYLIRQESQRPFDLEQGPLFRATLYRLANHAHVLLVVMHHIVGDGWSEDLLIHELGTLYEAYLGGQSSPLPELPIDYVDFARFQRDLVCGEFLERQLRYWKLQLADVPVLDLPTDLPRPPVQTSNGQVASMQLPKELTQSLKHLGQRQMATPFMTLLAAFQTLLYLHTGQTDISIGSPISGRNWTETENMIGLFLNTLVLRTHLSGDLTFKELLDRTRKTALDAYANQDVPFEFLLDALPVERDLSHTPLFQVMFNMLNYESNRLGISLPGLTVDTEEILEHGSKFDLTLYVREHDGCFLLHMVYNADLFDAAHMQWMLAHYQALLQDIVAYPDRPLSKLSLAGSGEWPALRVRSDEIKPHNLFQPFTRDEIEQTIAQRFEQQVEKHPHNIAVKSRAHQLTYRDLDRRANQVAYKLISEIGAGEERIALLFYNDAPMLVALLGILKSGKSYVPLEVSYPPERLAYILKDSQASAILTDNNALSLAQTLSGTEITVINIAEQDEISDPPRISPANSPDSLAYLLYTSGSTGEPKGVVQNQRNVLHHIRCYTNSLHISESDRLTLVASYSFDAAVMDIFGALLNGATLYPINPRETGLQELKRVLIDEGITIYHSTPTLYRCLIGELTSSDSFPDLRLVVLGGEEAVKTDVDLFKQHFTPDCLLVNGFGPTESTLSLQSFFNHHSHISRSSVPIGYAVEETEVEVVNEGGQRLPPYVVGEVAIKSEHLALGYWHNDELTKSVFLADPKGGLKRTYLTGDQGLVLADGTIEFRGRKDSQTKLRGYRIELAEIEIALRKHEAVNEAVVLVREREGEKRLVAYLVPDGVAPTPGELRAYLKEKLPESSIPSLFMLLDRIPLTPNGKVDHKALPVPDETRSSLLETYAAPSSPEEETLAKIWKQVLRMEEVGVHDDFFELGGDSLTIFLLLSRVRDAFSVEITARALFERSTVAGQAELLQSLK